MSWDSELMDVTFNYYYYYLIIIIIFRDPHDPNIVLIKRIIGLQGDTIK